MADYTCTIKFTDARQTSVVSQMTPTPPSDGLVPGDSITFTSPDGPWHVVYPQTPFRMQVRSEMISGAKGDSVRLFVNPQRKGIYKFRCLVDKADGESVGWADAGGDTNIKTT